MKLVVFGSTGGIGAQVVEQALEVGHLVTAVARRTSAISLQHERLEVVQGDALDAQAVQAAIAGKDAVVSALGVHSRAPTTLYSAGVANMLQAMASTNVRRLVCISASGLDPGPLWQHWIAKPILWAVLKEMYTDLVRMETVVECSPLDWTILRPPYLTNGPRTGMYQVSANSHMRKILSISRADVADYIVRHLSDPAAYRALVEIAY